MGQLVRRTAYRPGSFDSIGRTITQMFNFNGENEDDVGKLILDPNTRQSVQGDGGDEFLEVNGIPTVRVVTGWDAMAQPAHGLWPSGTGATVRASASQSRPATQAFQCRGFPQSDSRDSFYLTPEAENKIAPR